jgi:hypothetical protein
MQMLSGSRRFRVLWAVLAAVALRGPSEARADAVLNVKILYNSIVGVRSQNAGTTQPYTFTLSGCIGSFVVDGNTVPASVPWNIVNNLDFSVGIGFAPIDKRTDVVSVDSVTSTFTLYNSNTKGKQGWFGLWSPFGDGPSSAKTSTDYTTNVNWKTDNGPDQYREMAPSIASSNINTASVSVPGNGKFAGMYNNVTVNVTISCNQFTKYWGAFEVTTPGKASVDPLPGQDGTNYATVEQHDELRNPNTGFAYLVPAPNPLFGGACLLVFCIAVRTKRFECVTHAKACSPTLS